MGLRRGVYRRCRPALTFSPDYITANPMYVVELEGRVAGFYSLLPASAQEVNLENLFVAPDTIERMA